MTTEETAETPQIPKRRLAKLVEVKRLQGGDMGVWIDGELFPFFTADGYSLHIERGSLPNVRLCVVAERVTVDDSRLADQEEGDR